MALERFKFANRLSNTRQIHLVRMLGIPYNLFFVSIVLLNKEKNMVPAHSFLPVQVGVADVEPERPSRGVCGGLVDLGCPLGGLL